MPPPSLRSGEIHWEPTGFKFHEAVTHSSHKNNQSWPFLINFIQMNGSSRQLLNRGDCKAIIQHILGDWGFTWRQGSSAALSTTVKVNSRFITVVSGCRTQTELCRVVSRMFRSWWSGVTSGSSLIAPRFPQTPNIRKSNNGRKTQWKLRPNVYFTSSHETFPVLQNQSYAFPTRWKFRWWEHVTSLVLVMCYSENNTSGLTPYTVLYCSQICWS